MARVRAPLEQGMPDSRLPIFALAYLEEERHVKELADAVAAAGNGYAPLVEALLLKGGVRVAAEKRAAERGANAP